mmetsp:Transcript_37754/g.91835  ORF Transcript_37754/g.91835 Transcript_37754/m.91835 type:complete len:440 (-) Transcript_37754:371-1690(-)
MVESNVSHSVSTSHRNYLIPKEILQAIIALGQHKGKTPAWRTLIGSFYAGFFVGIGGLFGITVAGGLDPDFAHDFPMVPKVLVGLTFWIALLLILSYGGDLFTGNLMYLLLARVNNRVTTLQMLKNWVIVYLGNFAACACIAYFLGYLTEFFKDDPFHAYVVHTAEKKVHYDWGVLVVRGIGANWLVCLAVCLAVASQDQFSRTVSCFLPVFAFATIGFEHSVANMFYASLGLFYGADTSFGEFIAKNLIPVTIGNFIGGPIMCGLGLHILYHVQTEPKTEAPSPSQLAEIKKKKQTSSQGTVSTNFMKRYVRKTGEVIRMAVDVTIALSADGKPESIMSWMRLISRGKAEGMVTDDEHGFMCLHWDGGCPVEDCTIALADEHVCHMLGYSRAELSTMTLRDISYADDATLSTRIMRRVLAKAENTRTEEAHVDVVSSA